ncbi:DUF5615 family PIN-like protein [Candidatus Woesearchaeota archaeon]|nr:DUF5615 family PIN-like protein [Candidatus Woesearchaeota archaeon]
MKNLTRWKLLADLNISIKTVAYLQTKGIDIKRIDKSLSTDEDVVLLSRKEGRTILTFDKDFGTIYYFQQPKVITVIVISLHDQRAEHVNKILHPFLLQIPMERVLKKLIIITEGKWRVLG